MTDYLKFEVDATYCAGENGQRFMLVIEVSASSAEKASADVLQLMRSAFLADPRIDDCRLKALPARTFEVLQAPVIGLGRLYLADLVDRA